MNRDLLLDKVKSNHDKVWDVIVIGGGATGLGTAVDAASRGYETLLVEQSDFAKGTSSRSTKLVHGGVRYLAQGDLSLVFEALHERGLLFRNAPHLVRNQKFIIPIYEWWEGPFYNIGMKVYDGMAGKLGIGPSEKISKEETLKAIPNLDENGLLGGVIYYDGQFDDSRLAINLAQTAVENGAVVLNYAKAVSFIKNNFGLLEGIVFEDMETGEKHMSKGKTVINAAGVFADDITKLDDPSARRMIKPSQGVHIVLDNSFLQGDSAIMIPHTSDGRVLFAVPWHGKVVVGTTDTPIESHSLEPRALEEEIEFLITTSSKYLKKDPGRKDILSIFAGLRPLAAPDENEETKEISRKHMITVSRSGLITVTGGKWTTYRKMAEDVVDKAIQVGALDEKECVTKHMAIHGYVKNIDFSEPLYYYGAEKGKINELIINNKNLGEKIHTDLPYLKAQIVWAIRNEMARTVEDFLARRVRALFLNARASMEAAPLIAELMAKELSYDSSWIERQINEFNKLAKGYYLE